MTGEPANRFGRARFLSGVASTALAALWRARTGVRASPGDAFLWRVGVRSGAAGVDARSLATLAPGGATGRDRATLEFALRRSAQVDFSVVAHRGSGENDATTAVVYTDSRLLGPGRHALVWKPGDTDGPGTYVLRLAATDLNGERIVYREAAPGSRGRLPAPVVRVIGVDAAFARRSYVAGERATLVVAADSGRLTVQILHCGRERQPTYSNDTMNGLEVGDPIAVPWRGGRPGVRAPIAVELGDWPSGLYCARVTSAEGLVGFAPFVVRPARPRRRIAVVVPTHTWSAYNFYDADADGFGDSWYVTQAITTVDLTRPHLTRGVPYRYRSYDLAFLRWLTATGREVDYYADDDLERFARGDDLRSAYDLVVFPGHTEYVTSHAYDVVERYRDLGGNLLFLSANNFFRRVDRHGDRLELVGLWRDLGRPEAALCGAQYRASDRGGHQGPFVVADSDATGWAFEGTGLDVGSTFGSYGIEIDATAPASPPQTQVLARIPDLLGPGLTAEMTYYEHPSGARVFCAGALNFGGQVELWPETLTLLDNVWARLASA